MRGAGDTRSQTNSEFTLHFLFIHIPEKGVEGAEYFLFPSKVISQFRTKFMPKKNVLSFVGSITRKARLSFQLS